MNQKIIGGFFLDVKANDGCPLKKGQTTEQKTDMTGRRRYFFCGSLSYKCLLCFRARLFFDGLWSPAGKEMTSWLSFVMSNSEFVTFPLISWVRCGT